MVSEITDNIKSRGYWDVSIRPASFDEGRLAYESLNELVRNAQVRFRGWPVPFTDDRMPLLGGSDWVGQDVDASVVAHYEAWRLWTSGQFAHLRSVSADWRAGSERTPTPEGFAGVIEVWKIVFYLNEMLEFAARLSLAVPGCDDLLVSASLHGLKNRGLVVGQRDRREFVQPYPSRVARYTVEWACPRSRILAEPRQIAADAAREVLLRFGWSPSVEQILDHQAELDRG